MNYNDSMSQRIDAIFENGVFRPDVPVNIANGQRASAGPEARVQCHRGRGSNAGAASLKSNVTLDTVAVVLGLVCCGCLRQI